MLAVYEELARQSLVVRRDVGILRVLRLHELHVRSGTGVPYWLSGVPITPGFLETLGVAPALGRGFVGPEWTAGNPGAAPLSDGLGRCCFGADPAIVGRTVTINGAPCVVAGDSPATFDFCSTFTPGIGSDHPVVRSI